MHNAIKSAMVYLPAKLAMQKTEVTLSPKHGTRSQHGTGIAEIIIPLPPVYELPSRPSAASKLCFVFKNPIRRQYADLAYHCANPSCDNVCQLAVTCSGFVNPRSSARACILSTRTWLCHLHSSTPASGHQPTQPDTLPPRPTPPSLKFLLNQGLSTAES